MGLWRFPYMRPQIERISGLSSCFFFRIGANARILHALMLTYAPQADYLALSRTKDLAKV